MGPDAARSQSRLSRAPLTRHRITAPVTSRRSAMPPIPAERPIQPAPSASSIAAPPGDARAASATRSATAGGHDRRRRPGRGRRRAAARCATSPSTPPRDQDALASRHRRQARRARVDGARSSTPPTARFRMHVGRQDRAAQQAPAAAPATTSRWPTRPASPASAWRSHEDPDKAFQYTIKRNTVAVVSDGTAVLGLGDIGPEAAMPVMEGKAMLFKEFARRRRLPDLPRHQGPRRDRRDRQADRARLRRHQPRGHLRAALLRDRGPAEGRARHPRLPRRPARHRRRRARRAAQRAAS